MSDPEQNAPEPGDPGVPPTDAAAPAAPTAPAAPAAPAGSTEPPGASGSDALPPVVRTPGIEIVRRAFAAARAEVRRSGKGGPARTGQAGGRGRVQPGAQSRSGARPDDRDPQRLEAAVGRLLRERGWEADAAVGSITARWAEIVGDQVAAHATPTGFADGRLEVTADSSAWATQLRMLAPQLVRRLNEEAGEGTVRVVEVRGPSAPSWRRGPRSVKGRGPRDTYG